MINKKGGISPNTKEEMERAKNTDLVTLPTNILGTNCGNCRFFKGSKDNKIGFCINKQVNQTVSNRNCCALWENPGMIRPWETKKEGK